VKAFHGLGRLWRAFCQRLRPETLGGSGLVPVPILPVPARAATIMPSLSAGTVAARDAGRPYVLRAHAQARWRCSAG